MTSLRYHNLVMASPTEELEQLRRIRIQAVNNEKMKFQAIKNNAINEKTRKVLTLTRKGNTPFKDDLYRDEHNNVCIEWKGQEVAKNFDADMLSKTVEKHIFIGKGSRKRWHPEILGDYDEAGPYVYLGVSNKITLIKARTEKDPPIFKITIDKKITAKELSIPEQRFANSSPYHIKLSELLKYKLLPVNDRFGDGPAYCYTDFIIK